jgi:hypothetical protein
VTRPTVSIPFLQNDKEFLWFCLVCQDSGIPASHWLDITDKVESLALQAAVTLRLQQYKKHERKLLANEIAQAMWGSGDTVSDLVTEEEKVIVV